MDTILDKGIVKEALRELIKEEQNHNKEFDQLLEKTLGVLMKHLRL